ncbi:hypothetical protein [Effusibacillus consociatus]|uniref:Uncharacterized protein n=1 Tax=Effusibacillus consociatus TaxID=1117041 RepID=A0ABV9Q2J4_9BACL
MNQTIALPKQEEFQDVQWVIENKSRLDEVLYDQIYELDSFFVRKAILANKYTAEVVEEFIYKTGSRRHFNRCFLSSDLIQMLVEFFNRK